MKSRSPKKIDFIENYLLIFIENNIFRINILIMDQYIEKEIQIII
jgi:hypothetical protein